MKEEQKISLAHLTAIECPPPELIWLASLAGFNYVGIRPIMLGLPGEKNYDLANLPEMLADTKAAIKETGVGVYDIELARITDGVDVAKYAPAMEVAAELGASCVLSSIWTNDKDFYIDKFGELCDLAAGFGLTVNLEFVTWASVKNLQEALEVLNAVNRKNMGIMVDTLHFHRSRVELEELDAVPREWFHCVHLCDAPDPIPEHKDGLIHTGRGERYYVGEGSIDIIGILKHIPPVVYVIELPHINRTLRFGSAYHVKKCLDTLKQYLAKASL